ncbi:DJ-1/PfpI family protein [Enterovirga sp. CN4-39]|uniref:DJ-1/PfpI family protein n=1 Tax=Enterovirga sp. CN4-39 TaxID=3400910 RepID=UPI003C0CF526
MKQPSEPARLGIVLYEGVEPIDLGGTAGVVSMASRMLPHLSSVLVAEQAGPVRLAGGVTVLAEADFATCPPCDVFVVCGGPGWREQIANAAMLGFLRSRAREQVASVCTGALILAAAGILDDTRATTRRRAAGSEATSPLDTLRSLAPTTEPEAALIVEDRGVVTSGGVSLAIDGTLYLIGRIYGTDARDEVARLIEYDRAFEANRRALGIVGP